MSFRSVLTAAALVALAAGCTWSGRPDGGKPMHTTDYTPDPLTRQVEEPAAIDPLDGTAAGPMTTPPAEAQADAAGAAEAAQSVAPGPTAP